MNARLEPIMTRSAMAAFALWFAPTDSVPAQPACAPAPAGLVAWWRAENDAQDSAGLNHGSPRNGANFAPGKTGLAFSLDGQDDYVEIADPVALDLTTGITIEAWVRPASLASDADIVSKYDRAAAECSWRFQLLAGGRIRFDAAGERVGLFHRAVETTETVLALNTLAHVAATFDGSAQMMKVFVNGVEKAVALVPDSQSVNLIFPTVAPVWIGASRAFTGNTIGHFTGLVDEVSIYNRALSGSEIHVLHQAGAAGKCMPPALEVWSTSTNIPPRTFVNLQAVGGQPPYAFSLMTDPSGGSVGLSGPGQAVYRSGLTSSVIDVVRVTDSLGGEAQVVIQVTPLALIEWSAASGGNGHRYALSLSGTDWYSAENLAYSLGGHLVSINNQAEQDFITGAFLTGAFEHRPLWIGLTDDGHEGSYRWTSLEPLASFEYWQPGEPNLGMDESFGAINWHYSISSSPSAKGRWSDNTLGGSIGAGGESDGPYYGIFEFPPALQITPAATNLPTTGIATFRASGGNPPYRFTFVTNRSGGTITANGLGNYTAGTTADVVDIIRVTDSLGASADASIEVTSLNLVEWPVSAGGNGHRYASLPVPQSWRAANDGAIRLGGYLATITSAAEQVFINETFLIGSLERRPFWIGLNDEDQEGIFAWVNGDPLSFTFWDVGEPNHMNAGEDFVAINWHYSNPLSPGIKGSWSDAGLFGSADGIAESDGPYQGIIEIPPPLQITPATTNISVGETIQFMASGAEGSVTYTIDNFPASALGTINPSTGLYTARNFCTGMDRIRVMDAAGRMAFASVQYVDRQPPVITCPANQTTVADPDGTAPIPSFFPHYIADSCGGVSFAQSPPFGTLVGIGLHLVTLTATDDSGNTDSCVASLTVLPRTYVVSGRVTNLVSGAPMPGQKVRLVHYHPTNRVFLQTFTDALGAYRFADIPDSRLLSVFPENRGFVYTPPWVQRRDFAADLVANFGATMPPATNQAVAVAGIEVVQSVQDWKNSVPLIADKDTTVRVNIRNNPATGATGSHSFTGKLRGFRSGVELPDSPLNPLSPGYATTDGDAISRRKNLATGTLNFQLPVEWCAAGTIELQLQPDAATPAACLDPAEFSGGQEHDCTVRASFQPLGIVRLKVYRNLAERHPLTYAEIDSALSRLKAMYPAHELDVQFGETYGEGGRGGNFLFSFLSSMQRQQMLDGCGYGRCGQFYFGAFSEPVLGGVAEFPGTVACGNLVSLPHEIGHLLGLDHSVRRDIPCQIGEICGRCGERSYPYLDPPDFPYFASLDGRTVATLGPMDPAHPEDMIFGLFNQPSQNSSGGTLSVVSPYSEFEMMSYCNDLSTGWPSAFSYQQLINGISSKFPSAGQFSAAAAGGIGQFYLVGGRIFPNDGAVEIDPLVPAFVPDPGPPSPGDYTVQLLNQSGAILSETSFQPAQPSIEAPEASARVLIFNLLVPYAPDAVRAVVRSNATTIAEVTRNEHAPVVAILSPLGGEVFSDDAIPIGWLATDADGDPLAFTVQYSADNGVSFTTLTTGTTNTFLNVSRDSLPSGSSAIVRVVASDGFNHDEQISAPFAVANNRPLVFVQSPANGSHFTGDASLLFTATSYDAEDGSNQGQLVWRSSLDGELGVGRSLTRGALSLSEGLHLITAIVTDSAGATNGASFMLEIARFRQPRLESLGFDPSGQFGLRIIADEGARYVLQASTNLQNWFPLQTNTMTSSVLDLRDPGSMNRAQLFYRSILAP